MPFDPGLKIGDEVTNTQLQKIFKCGNMGGMRRAKATGSLVIISDQTKPFYHDKWKGGVLHYTGMGKYGDQVLDGNQNRTLYDSDTNGVAVYLFEVLEKAIYTFKGQIRLVDKPYQDNQPDEEGRVRKVWIFPIAPIDDVDLENPDPAKLVKLSLNELAHKYKATSKPKEPKLSQIPVYDRNEYLKSSVKRIAEGKCQLCGADAPFIDKNGEPYLEEHHVVRLADGGPDTIENVVAICPNCHRRVHNLGDKEDIIRLEKIAANNAEVFNRFFSYTKAVYAPNSQ